MEVNFNILKLTNNLDEQIQNKIDSLTKPLGALGRLEEIALRVCKIQNTLEPELTKPSTLVFAGDHGAAKEGISPYPQEVTYQMVLNIINNGAGINVFSKQNGMNVKVIDMGVNHEFENVAGLINKKIAFGTKSYLSESAMTKKECLEAVQIGSEMVQEEFLNGTNIIGFGEMGIGNTSSAALIMSKISGLAIEKCTGKGAGFDDDGLNKKIELLKKALNLYPNVKDPIGILQHFGGFEVAAIVGGMLKAAENKMIILVDGFIATSSLLIARALYNEILDYTFFCHNSNEQGHKKMLESLNANPILDLGLRLGEGTGAAIAYPIIKAAVNMINEMATFGSANVSEKVD